MRDVTRKIRQQDVKALTNLYSPTFRKVELASIVLFFCGLAVATVRLGMHASDSPWLLLAAVLTGYIAADFVGGWVHWLADTWGSTRTPLVGKALIRPFREHHIDEKAITRHDFIETNGANCMVALPVMLLSIATPLSAGGWYEGRLFLSAFLASLVLSVMATNQFHKWAHADRVPLLIGWLQKLHLILPPAHHAIHHTAPFSKYYCITTGWLNWPLDKLGFYRLCERAMTAWLGWLPRQDDLGEAAALAMAEEPIGTSSLTAAEKH